MHLVGKILKYLQIQIMLQSRQANINIIEGEFKGRSFSSLSQNEVSKLLDELKNKGVTDVIVLPLYPHYAMSSYETVVEKVKTESKKWFPDIKTSNIPEYVMKNISENLAFNQSVIQLIEKKEKDLEDGLSKDLDNEKKISNNRISPELKNIQKEISSLKKSLKSIMLSDQYIPNRASHFDNWAPDTVDFNKSNVFTCSMDEDMVEKIMLLENVKPLWKLLLLMGIGALKLDNDSCYNEIMKTLAQNQQLYLIIASSDYIYGTNYQFCHGYLSKDLGDISQEKMIQAFGRVGRSSMQKMYTIRLRNDELIRKLFMEEINKPEVKNMNKLFV